MLARRSMVEPAAPSPPKSPHRRRGNSVQSVDSLVDAMKAKQIAKPHLSILTEFITMSPISLRFSRASIEKSFLLEHGKKYAARYRPLMATICGFMSLAGAVECHSGKATLGGLKLAVAAIAGGLALVAKHIFDRRSLLVPVSGGVVVAVYVCQILDEGADAALFLTAKRGGVGLVFLLYVAVGIGIGMRFLASVQISFVLTLLALINLWVSAVPTPRKDQVESTLYVVLGFVFFHFAMIRQIEIHERREFRLIKRLTAENVQVQMQMENFSLFAHGINDSPRAKSALVSPGGLFSPTNKIHANDVELFDTIGCGAHGEVVRGKFKSTIVAVKTIKGEVKDEYIREMGVESTLMADLRHPNIVMFMGMCLFPPMILMEYCSRGSVFDVLHVKCISLDWSLLLRILLDASQGMAFLHQYKPPIIHHDLKSLNMLLDPNWRCKVSDFGLSRFKKKHMMDSQHTMGSIPWMAPEVSTDNLLTEKVDVYAIGIIIFECLTSEMPYPAIPIQGIPHLVAKGRRPTDYAKLENIPSELDGLVALMKACWAPSPADRPDFDLIVDTIELHVCPAFFKDATMADAIVYPRDRNQSQSQKEQDILMANLCFNIKESELVLGTKIGGGSYGAVYAGKWLGTDVAIKQLFLNALGEKVLKDFHKECDLMRQLRHPNIVLFLGSSAQPPNLFLVTELLAKGSLFDIYHAESRIEDASKHYKRVLQAAADMARGMAYLHSLSPPLIHRDMKSPNIMVDSHWVAKIGDFGLSRIKDETKTMTKCGSPLWVAPEILQGHRFAEGCDIFSFGIIVWEVVSWSEPYPDMSSKDVMRNVAMNGLRPAIPESCPPDLGLLLGQCWRNEPDDRPSFAVILDRLTSMQRVLSRDI
ncbi:TKL/DRK protein kinase [Saprolegnia parasitica CBS 223.65]|uniref:TKL/DRK protein kinase n=1 Tax=Saprolegnia parasitica (strain CBS 223.65) TaxID=695850 RepID=A0A067CNJ5_SAPPC|nr:TKL/DRK protein kinase [Saprolegnia parasitica CBS 223.65]KDO28392.1 TKL/DRK protein kinase [Saprolegnia parasitica CBS 223.65]|eukprot:XP_012200834.1 TKL/DRK protein kinase [Saprolegnia parasitica CBS 223.65]